jgi:condensin-2 complex subunit D3
VFAVKAPLLAYNSFVEAIFILNDCHAHNGHNDSQGSRVESRLFSIRLVLCPLNSARTDIALQLKCRFITSVCVSRGNDENSRSKRMHIYVSLLKQMAPEHLLATFAKLCAEILAAASDGMLDIEDITGQSVLQVNFVSVCCG